MGNSRGRPPQPRRRRGRQAGPHAHRRRRRGRRARRQRGAARRAARRTSACTSSAWSPTAACTRAGPPRGADRAGRGRGVPTSSSTPSPTGATRRRTAAPATCRRSRRWCAAGARASAPSSAATSRWTATSAGSASRRRYDLLSHGARRTTPRRGAQAVRAAYERDETDEFIEPTTRRRRGAHPPRRQRHRLQLPPRPHAPARCDRAARRDRGRRATDDADRVRGGLALPGRLPAASARRSRCRRSSRRPAARQLHVAETEKYPHVTYFFGGGEEDPESGERRELVPSPRDVPTYDHKPRDERPRGGRRRSSRAWREDELRFGIINFANADMVGHTGVDPGGGRGDRDGRRVPRRRRRGRAGHGGVLLITADHGNADDMLEPDGSPEHRALAQPGAVRSSPSTALALRDGGILADVAPTLLELLGIEQPAAMTGRSLLA